MMGEAVACAGVDRPVIEEWILKASHEMRPTGGLLWLSSES